MKDVDDLEEEEHEYFAEDEVTPLDPVLLPGAPLTAMTVCPKQEWLALMNIQYYDMMMVVDDDNENQEEESSSPQQQRRRRLARHSTIAEVRIQISPLSLPFSSKYREVLHRLELPHLPSVTSPTSKKHQHHHHRHNDRRHKQKQSYLDDEHLEHSGKHAPVQPSLVFSSDRRNLACLIPFPRGSHSAVVSFTLQRPTPHSAPRPRPAIPAYIPTSTNTTTRSNFLVPETSGEPQWLTFPTHAALDIRQHALYWLHNITSLCDTSAISGKQRSGTRGSSVLLAGCRDGSILGISFNPLLLAGVLYHPAQGKGDGAVTFLSHITTNAAQASTDSTSEMMYNRGGVLGRLVAVRESGKAQIFQTRMVLSSLNDDDDDTEDHSGSFSALNDMDTTDYSASDHPASSGAAGVAMIHGESFHVVKTGRRNSLPANARLAIDEHDQHNLHASWRPKQQDDDYDNAPVGTTGLLMFLEPLSELSGCVSRAQWITGVLLVVLDKPTMSGGYRQSKKSDDAKNRVAQVLGVFPDRRSPETLSELLLTHEDLREHAHTTFSLEEEEEVSLHSENADSSGNPSMARNPLLDQNLFHFLEASHGIHADPLSGCLAISSVRISSKSAMKTKNEEEKKANDDSP